MSHSAIHPALIASIASPAWSIHPDTFPSVGTESVRVYQSPVSPPSLLPCASDQKKTEVLCRSPIEAFSHFGPHFKLIILDARLSDVIYSSPAFAAPTLALHECHLAAVSCAHQALRACLPAYAAPKPPYDFFGELSGPRLRPHRPHRRLSRSCQPEHHTAIHKRYTRGGESRQ